MISWTRAVILSMANKRQAVFFDRDGTLNVDKDYLYRIEDFEWTPEAVEAIRYCHQQGYLVIVITNQSGVARGYYKEEDVHRLHQWMNEQLGEDAIDAFYYCPHHPKAQVTEYAVDCDCRKPKAGMVLQAIKDYDIDPAKSLMVGDKQRDIECGLAAGVSGALYTGGSLLELIRGYIPR